MNMYIYVYIISRVENKFIIRSTLLNILENLCDGRMFNGNLCFST